jgi:hypothetical protein
MLINITDDDKYNLVARIHVQLKGIPRYRSSTLSNETVIINYLSQYYLHITSLNIIMYI